MASLVQAAAVLVVLLPLVSPSASTAGPVVRVAQGSLRGRVIQRTPNAKSPSARTIYAFEGVPYAKPPVGQLRFKDPQEAETWTGIRNATQFGPNCIQRNLEGSVSGEEDCLYLNIYTADPPEKWKSVKRPVIVFIHGGAFVMWSGDTSLARPDPLVNQGIVYVSLNYRLAVMGFLNTEDSQAPGNAALKDQSMVLRWVQKNIAAFGGDPNSVTIMGESAGGASVHYQMLSPLSRGLFHRAVSVSGTVVSRWASLLKPRENALALRLRFAGACPDEPFHSIVPCLQRVDARELVLYQYDVQQEQGPNIFGRNTFLPSPEAHDTGSAPFLTAPPERLLREGRFARVPFITGVTSGEGIIYLGFGQLLVQPSRWNVVDESFEDVFRGDLPQGLRTREAAREVRKFYFGDRSLRDGNENMDTLNRFVQMAGDIYMELGAVTSAKIMADHGAPVYLYEFSRDGPLIYWKEINNTTYIPGVGHGDDMLYVFDYTNTTTGELLPVPPSEQPIRDRQAKIFTNFAKTGNPTPPGSGLVPWPMFTSQKESYIDMDVELSVRNYILGNRTAFWRNLMNTAQPSNSRPQTTRGRKV